MNDEAYAVGAVVAVIAAGLVIATVGMAAYVIYYYVLRGLLARTATEPARVVRKIQRESGGGGYGLLADDWPGDRDDCLSLSYNFFVVFELDRGPQEFAVPMRVYADLEEGDIGVLIHRGTIFRKFIKSAPIFAPGAKTQIHNV